MRDKSGPAKPDSIAIHDSIALAAASAAHDSLANAMSSVTTVAPVGGDTLALHDSSVHAPTTAAPIGLDTTIAAMVATRAASRMQYGWIRVVINGGTAPAKIDGVRQGSTPIMRRVEEGEHLVTVDGAGDSFLPSQITVTVSAGDTSAAVFATPEAMRRVKSAKTPEAPAPSPADSATSPIADSAVGKPPL